MAAKKDVVASVLKLADKTAGRDRICRLVQYGSRFVYWVMEQEGVSPEMVKKLRKLESSISTARKLFRLGKCVDSFRGAMQTIHLTNPLLRLLITLVKLNRGLYLLFDHLIWAGRMRLVTINMDFWNRLSMRFWLLTIVLSLLRDLYEVALAIRTERNRLNQYSSSPGSSKSSLSLKQLATNVVNNNPALVVDVVKNGADVLIPTARLDMIGLPSGIVGLVGVISSIAGLISIWDEHLKLKFS